MIPPAARALALLLPFALAAACAKPAPAPSRPVRAAVIGGITMTGLWTALADQFQRQTGLTAECAATGNKEVIIPAFRAGQADIILIHSCDEATALVADGLAQNIQPWAWNELVIAGPPEDPAGVRGLRDGAEALRRIAAKQAPFVDGRGAGRRVIAESLWHKAGIVPSGPWIIPDGGTNRWQTLEFAAARRAYTIAGRIPILFGKLPPAGLEILVEGDPAMRRPYISAEARPRNAHTPNTAATLFAAFLTDPKTQDFLLEFARAQPGGVPLFYPVESSRVP